MKYTETRIFTSTQGLEPVTALLMSHGIENFIIDDPRDIREIIEMKESTGSANWDYINPSLIREDNETIITFYTEDTEMGNEQLQDIKLDMMKLKSDEMYGNYGKSPDFGRMYSESKPLDDDWKELWKKNLKPFKVTDSIVIKPSWEKYDQKIDELVIEIDPQMAFGTGTHATTSSSIKMLEQAIEQGCSVLDIGTGTGVLAIVAAKCGAGKVDAVEFDDTACEVADANVILNGAGETINIIECDILTYRPKHSYDVIVANLNSGLITKLIPEIINYLSTGGTIILSGMLSEERNKMMCVLEENNLTVNSEIIDGEWYTVKI